MREYLDRMLDEMAEDELEVMVEIAEGLTQGRRQYGPLVLDTDERDFHEEGIQELRDFCIYEAAVAIQRRRS